jgi:quinolinate synthase
LEKMSPEVKVPEEIRLRAKAAVDKMLEGKSKIKGQKSK